VRYGNDADDDLIGADYICSQVSAEHQRHQYEKAQSKRRLEPAPEKKFRQAGYYLTAFIAFQRQIGDHKMQDVTGGKGQNEDEHGRDDAVFFSQIRHAQYAAADTVSGYDARALPLGDFFLHTCSPVLNSFIE